jgi:hypothetical protein
LCEWAQSQNYKEKHCQGYDYWYKKASPSF